MDLRKKRNYAIGGGARAPPGNQAIIPRRCTPGGVTNRDDKPAVASFGALT